MHINGTLAHTVRSANGRRIFVSASPGTNTVQLVVLDVLGMRARLFPPPPHTPPPFSRSSSFLFPHLRTADASPTYRNPDRKLVCI